MRALEWSDTEVRSEVKRPEQEKASSCRGWLKLIMWSSLVWLFVFVFAPWLQGKSASLGTMAEYVRKSGIDASAIYYTEVEEVADADLMIRDTFRFFLDQ